MYKIFLLENSFYKVYPLAQLKTVAFQTPTEIIGFISPSKKEFTITTSYEHKDKHGASAEKVYTEDESFNIFFHTHPARAHSKASFRDQLTTHQLYYRGIKYHAVLTRNDVQVLAVKKPLDESLISRLDQEWDHVKEEKVRKNMYKRKNAVMFADTFNVYQFSWLQFNHFLAKNK
jgi:hypothetical protein